MVRAKIDKIIEKYSKAVSHYPYFVFMIVIIITVIAGYFAAGVGTSTIDDDDMIPDEYPAISSFNIISDSFGGSDSAMFAIEIDPSYVNSDEPRDIRDPEVIKYVYLLEQIAETVDDVESASGPGSLIRSDNSGALPKSRNDINTIIEKDPVIKQYLSDDYTLAIIKIDLNDEYDVHQIAEDLKKAINYVPKPSGVDVKVAGQVIADPVIEQQVQPDMKRTSRFSMIGIVIVLLLLFGSIRYSAVPLLVIGLGVLWTFGYLGMTGMGINARTSAAVSMIMGIGIDFGIQIIMRFKQELKREKTIEKAMETTMKNVFMPMATTTIAALIGFKAMGMGDLSFLQELATIMSYGIASCFLVAITLVPAIAIITERMSRRKTKIMLNIFRRGYK